MRSGEEPGADPAGRRPPAGDRPRVYPPSTGVQAVGLAGWLLVCFAAAAAGGIASSGAGEFYRQLARPDWAPAAWLFGPVWTILYILMAVSAWLVWRARGFYGARAALTLFIVQLVFNALWTWLFFAWREGALALTEIILLWMLILATIGAFWRVRPAAGALLVPYLLWVSYAAVLTYALWSMNPLELA